MPPEISGAESAPDTTFDPGAVQDVQTGHAGPITPDPKVSEDYVFRPAGPDIHSVAPLPTADPTDLSASHSWDY